MEPVCQTSNEKIEPFTVATVAMENLAERFPGEDLARLEEEKDPLTGRKFRCTFTVESDAYTIRSLMEALMFMKLTNDGKNEISSMILSDEKAPKALPLHVIVRDDFGQYDSFNTAVKEYMDQVGYRVEREIRAANTDPLPISSAINEMLTDMGVDPNTPVEQPSVNPYSDYFEEDDLEDQTSEEPHDHLLNEEG